MSNFIQKITHKGIKPDMNASEEKRVIITNYILLLASLVAFGRVFMFYFSGDLNYSIISIFATGFFLFSYIMNTRGYYDFAKFVLIIVGNFATGYKEISSGGEGNQIALIIAGFMTSMLLFDIKEKVKLFTALSIAGINLIISIFFVDLFEVKVVLDPATYLADKIVGVLSASVIVILVAFYFAKKSNDAESKLMNSNRLLQKYNDEVFEQKEQIEVLLNKSDKLLLNILPEPIAQRLKEGEKPIADNFFDASIIFIDIVDFTKISANSTPESLVQELNSIFSHFDKISKKYGIEKIKTIGDCYMAAAGIPEVKKDHAFIIAKMALEVINSMIDYKTKNGFDVKFRIGLDCGPVVAGVIGEQKFIYDLWGDPVNTASRMESHGLTNKIQATERFKKTVEKQSSGFVFKFKERGIIEVKGMGQKRTFFLEEIEEVNA